MDHTQILRGLQSDCAAAHEEQDLAVYALSSREWVLPATSTYPTPRDFGERGLVACFAGSQRLVSDEEESVGTDTLLEIASFAQDEIIALRGRGWPEHVVENGPTSLLVPEWHDDSLWWCAGGQPIFAVGSLPQQVAVL